MLSCHDLSFNIFKLTSSSLKLLYKLHLVDVISFKLQMKHGVIIQIHSDSGKCFTSKNHYIYSLYFRNFLFDKISYNFLAQFYSLIINSFTLLLLHYFTEIFEFSFYFLLHINSFFVNNSTIFGK